MSFCGGSFCTYCHGASCASGTSGSWLTGAVRSCSPCASRCWPQRPNHDRSPARQSRIFRDHSGPAHTAEARWGWSRDSRPPKRECALLHLQGKHHDLLFDISNAFSAETPAPKLRVLSAQSAPREQSTPPTPLQTYFSLYPNSACKRPCRHSKPITSRVQTAHFKSLYRKRSGPGLSACSRSSSSGAFPDTALGLTEEVMDALWLRVPK